MSNNRLAQIIGLVVVVLTSVVQFALLPQPDFSIPPLAKFILGCLQVALTTMALYMNVKMPGQT